MTAYKMQTQNSLNQYTKFVSVFCWR